MYHFFQESDLGEARIVQELNSIIACGESTTLFTNDDLDDLLQVENKCPHNLIVEEALVVYPLQSSFSPVVARSLSFISVILCTSVISSANLSSSSSGSVSCT